MEFSNERISGRSRRRRFTSTILSQSTVSTRIPQPIVWRWRPHTHWPRCSTVPHGSWRSFRCWSGRFESSTTNGGFMVARRSKGKFGCCRRREWWSSEAGYGRPPERTAPTTTAGRLTSTSTAVPASNQKCHAFFCK